MLISWYWPNRHRSANTVALGALRPGDRLVVQSLAAYAGEPITGAIDQYEVVRNLPDPVRARGSRLPGPVHVLVGALRRQWARYRQTAQLRPQVLHLQQIELDLDWLVLPWLRRRFGVVTVGVVHDVAGPHQPRWPAPVVRWLVARTYRPACLDLIVVYHQVLADELVRDFGVAPERIAVVPHPLDVVASVRAAGAGPDRTVLFFGSFRPDKGIPVLVEAISSLSVDPHVRFVLAGRGDGDLEAAVRALGDERPDVTAEVGYVSDERREELLGQADLLVLPYTEFHSQSGVLFDAYARGIPVVVSDVGAIGPTVAADGTGWVVDAPPTADGLADALRTALGDGNALAARQAAVLEAAHRYEGSAVGPILRDAYDRAVARRQG